MATLTANGCHKVCAIKRKLDESELFECVEGNVIYALRSDGTVLSRCETKYVMTYDGSSYWNRGTYTTYGKLKKVSKEHFEAALKHRYPDAEFTPCR